MTTLTRQARSDNAFTMVELVIAVIIIAILVAITVPILQERAAQAKMSAARADMENIAAAQERAILDTGYMYRLFVLDDIPGTEAAKAINDPRVGQDAFGNEVPRDQVQTVNMDNFFIDPRTGEFIDDVNAADILFERIAAETAYDIGLGGSWNGPYVTWQRDTERPTDTTITLRGDDIPNDPWGNNYILFTRYGVVWEPLPAATDLTTPGTPPPANDNMQSPVNLGDASYNFKRFDRPTILSMGPDGLPGGSADRTFGMGDDLVRQF